MYVPTLSPLGERVARGGAFTSRRGTGEGVESLVRSVFGPHISAQQISKQSPWKIQFVRHGLTLTETKS